MREEQQRHELRSRQASAKGKVIQKKAYYGQSFHIVLEYAGHRRDLLTVYGHKETVAILRRLQYCDQRLNEAINIGSGGQTPGQDWKETPGGLGS